MPTVLVTGANRGLGLEFCKQYGRDGWVVIACCRRPGEAEELMKLAQGNSIAVEALDVGDFAQIDALAAKLNYTPIDILLNNAGIYTDTRENGFGRVDYASWQQSFRVNTMAPLKIAEVFLPQLKLSQRKLIVNISSLMGSIADNNSGGSFFYRSSKAALNAVMKSLALDLAGQSIGVLTLHPGWVLTDMGGSNALITAEESVSKMRAVIEKFSINQSGCFIKFDGTMLPW